MPTRPSDSLPVGGVIDLLVRAPTSRPLVVLHSGRPHPRWSKWSVIAQPAAILRHDHGRTTWQTIDGSCESPPRFTNDPLVDLAWLDTRLAGSVPDRTAPACGGMPGGGWFGYLSYDLGRFIEPRSASPRRHSGENPTWPLYEWLWCPQIFVHDVQRGQWFRAGVSSSERIEPAEVLESLGVESGAAPVPPAGPCVGPWRADQRADEVASSVARVIEYIRAGDIFQANIAQHFDAPLNVAPRQLAAAAWRRTPNWYAAFLELAVDRQVLSLSPELFLEVDRASGTIITRPLKGTIEASRLRSTLERSVKDEAELNMIVDLMRNDLGRICEYGSVRVTQPRAIESHPTVHHGVATIEGRLRQRIGFADMVRATCPAGSITGAPKIRAMQIIDELERAPRGPYCGSLGFVGVDRICLNVAIRTMCIDGDQVRYGAGAGIVADSVPELECAEMLAKTAVIQGLAEAESVEARAGSEANAHVVLNG